MEIIFEIDLLKDALNKLTSVADKKSSKAVLNNCYFQVFKNSCYITASDIDISAKIRIEIISENEFNFCINQKHLFEIIKELPKGTVTFSLETDKNLLEIRHKNSKYQLYLFNSDEYPQISFGNIEEVIKIKSSEVITFLNLISHAVSNDETRVFLNGIFLTINSSKLKTIAIDGHRLAMYELKEFLGTSRVLENGVIIPKKAISEIKKIAENSNGKDLEFSFDESHAYIKLDQKYYLSIRLIAREYPKYQSVVPNKTTYKLTVNKNELFDSLKRVKILSNEKTNGVKLILNENKITLSSSHSTAGSAQDEINAEYSGEKKEIGINAKYILDVLSVIDDEKVHFEFNNELSPIVIRSEIKPQFLSVIMPLKL